MKTRHSFALSDKSTIALRVPGSILIDDTSTKTQGSPGYGSSSKGLEVGNAVLPDYPYKLIRPTVAGASMSISCVRKWKDNEYPFPITDDEAWEYAKLEHEVDIPVDDWPKLMTAPFNVAEYLYCRSPDYVREADKPAYLKYIEESARPRQLFKEEKN